MQQAVMGQNRKSPVELHLWHDLAKRRKSLASQYGGNAPTQSQPPSFPKSNTKIPASQPAARSSTSGWRSASTVSRWPASQRSSTDLRENSFSLEASSGLVGL